MGSQKPSRAARMAATYADILIKVGAYQPQKPKEIHLSELHNQIVRGEVNWWQVCIGSSLTGKK